MKNFETVDQALDFAISEEEGAVTFYNGLADRVTQPGMKDLLLSFAKEEEGHKAKLLEIKAGKRMLPAEGKVQDLKIGDYTVDVEATADVGYQDALIIAMKKEKAAYKMYVDLASSSPDASIEQMFMGLAREEANHKLRFEMEYDDEVMSEN